MKSHSYSTAEDENGNRFCETCRISHEAPKMKSGGSRQMTKTSKTEKETEADKTLKHWGYGRNLTQTTAKASGKVLTESNLQDAIEVARRDMSKPMYFPDWPIKMMGYGKHKRP
jgi:hypothetical protein